MPIVSNEPDGYEFDPFAVVRMTTSEEFISALDRL